MNFISARGMRTAVMVIALSAGGLWALRAMEAKAEPPAFDDRSPCAEGRALFAAKLAYLEARIAPETSQQDAWRQFAGTMRASAGELDRSCTEDAPQRCSVDAGERLKRMGKHAAALQAMFGAMASAYEAIVPNLTTAQRDILSRNIVAPPPFPLFPPRGLQPQRGDVPTTCAPGSHSWGAPPL